MVGANESGFSTLELLVTMALMSIIISQILSVVGSQQQNFSAHQEMLEVQEDSRLVSDLMLMDVRMAGFMVPKTVGISSLDGGAAGSDTICMSDASTIDPGTLDTNDRFDGAHVTVALAGTDSEVLLPVADLDIDNDTTVDFALGGGIIISDGNRTHCALITGLDVATGDIDFAPPTPAGFVSSILETRVAPAIIYQVTGAGLLRNSLLFSSQVEDVQIEYDAGGVFPVHVLSGANPDQVSRVRLSVLVRTQRNDLGFVGGSFPAIANRNAGVADTFRRRLVVNMISPRNFL